MGGEGPGRPGGRPEAPHLPLPLLSLSPEPLEEVTALPPLQPAEGRSPEERPSLGLPPAAPTQTFHGPPGRGRGRGRGGRLAAGPAGAGGGPAPGGAGGRLQCLRAGGRGAGAAGAGPVCAWTVPLRCLSPWVHVWVERQSAAKVPLSLGVSSTWWRSLLPQGPASPGEQQQSQRGTVPGPSFDLVPKHFRGRGCPQLRPPPTHCHSHAISWRAGGSGRAWLQGGDPVKHLTGGLGYCLYWVYPR